jgi:hypothetical protein
MRLFIMVVVGDSGRIRAVADAEMVLGLKVVRGVRVDLVAVEVMVVADVVVEAMGLGVKDGAVGAEDAAAVRVPRRHLVLPLKHALDRASACSKTSRLLFHSADIGRSTSLSAYIAYSDSSFGTPFKKSIISIGAGRSNSYKAVNYNIRAQPCKA